MRARSRSSSHCIASVSSVWIVSRAWVNAERAFSTSLSHPLQRNRASSATASSSRRRASEASSCATSARQLTLELGAFGRGARFAPRDAVRFAFRVRPPDASDGAVPVRGRPRSPCGFRRGRRLRASRRPAAVLPCGARPARRRQRSIAHARLAPAERSSSSRELDATAARRHFARSALSVGAARRIQRDLLLGFRHRGTSWRWPRLRHAVTAESSGRQRGGIIPIRQAGPIVAARQFFVLGLGLAKRRSAVSSAFARLRISISASDSTLLPLPPLIIRSGESRSPSRVTKIVPTPFRFEAASAELRSSASITWPITASATSSNAARPRPCRADGPEFPARRSEHERTPERSTRE